MKTRNKSRRGLAFQPLVSPRHPPIPPSPLTSVPSHFLIHSLQSSSPSRWRRPSNPGVLVQGEGEGEMPAYLVRRSSYW